MKTCFSTVTGYPGARSNLLVRLACIAFVSGSTISLSFAGYQYGGVRGSPPGFVGPVQRIGFTASHGNVAVGNPYLGGYRGGAMGYPEYRGPLVAPNRAPVGSRNAFVPSPASQIGTIRRQEVVPQTRDPNPPSSPTLQSSCSGTTTRLRGDQCSEEQNWVTTSICQSRGV